MVADPTLAPLAATRGAGALARWTAVAPVIDPGRILRLHGYRDESRIRPVIRKTASEMAARAAGLIEAVGCWRRVAIEASGAGEVRLAGGVTLSCPVFDRLLEGVPEVAVFVLTLGEGFDAAVIGLMEAFEPLEALFLETAGRLAIERLTRVLAADLGRMLAREGLAIGARLGPGYSYRLDGRADQQRAMWPLEQQHQLFALFGSADLPVELMESAVMRPKMSRSGLFGIATAR